MSRVEGTVRSSRARTRAFRIVAGFLGVLAFVLALIVAVAYGVDQAALQRNGTPALDPHAELHHYSGMAVMGLLLAAGALATATGGGGPRAIGWATGIGAALYGAASLAYPDHLGTVDTPWAVLTLLWGLALVTLTELEMRRPPTTREPG
jgi:amino acid transporter